MLFIKIKLLVEDWVQLLQYDCHVCLKLICLPFKKVYCIQNHSFQFILSSSVGFWSVSIPDHFYIQKTQVPTYTCKNSSICPCLFYYLCKRRYRQFIINSRGNKEMKLFEVAQHVQCSMSVQISEKNRRDRQESRFSNQNKYVF